MGDGGPGRRRGCLDGNFFVFSLLTGETPEFQGEAGRAIVPLSSHPHYLWKRQLSAKETSLK